MRSIGGDDDCMTCGLIGDGGGGGGGGGAHNCAGGAIPPRRPVVGVEADDMGMSDQTKMFLENLRRGFVTQEKPDCAADVSYKPEAPQFPGGIFKPLATQKDAFGNVRHIVREGKSYMLVVGSYDTGFRRSTHWDDQAVLALIALVARIEVSLK